MNLPEYNRICGEKQIPGGYRSVVFTLHGMKTTGKWQKELVPALVKSGFLPIPLDYGYKIDVFWFFTKGTVAKCDRAFMDKHAQHLQEIGRWGLSVVAHSFGTFALGYVLERHPGIVLSRVITTGSILKCDFPWQGLAEERRVDRVRNEYAENDWVVRLAPVFVRGAGVSGIKGFNMAECVENYDVRRAGHDGIFHEAWWQGEWIPFLAGKS